MDNVFSSFQEIMQEYKSNLAFANSRSRLRMITLYQIAQSNNGLVVGTGNKVEDFGVGFYTKYGDGGRRYFSSWRLYQNASLGNSDQKYLLLMT